MQREPGMTGGINASESSVCQFCSRESIRSILKETQLFLIAADHAPLVEGHLLIIPKLHYTCYGDVPAELDGELQALKQEVQRFFAEYYAPAVYWEHGIFRQTVYHAHLHCFPFGTTNYNISEGKHEEVVSSQDDIRAWYASRGHYFYLEDENIALLFPPDMDRYLRVLRDILWQGTVARTGNPQWRSAQLRQIEGVPLIAALVEKWQAFQQSQHAEIR